MLYVNKIPIEVTKFPDGTSQVWKLSQEVLSPATKDDPDYPYKSIVWVFEDEGEFFHLIQLKTLLDCYGCKTILYLPYLPYGRQDKEISNEATFALWPFAKFINFLGFDRVTIMDPHSRVSTNLILNSEASYPMLAPLKAIEGTGANTICYPDAGAAKKYPGIYRYLKDYNTVLGKKVREPLTGNITGFDIEGEITKDSSVLIIDDICDAGGTFIGLTDLLLKKGAKSVCLYVTHGLFTKGLSPLKEASISSVYTAKGLVY